MLSVTTDAYCFSHRPELASCASWTPSRSSLFDVRTIKTPWHLCQIVDSLSEGRLTTSRKASMPRCVILLPIVDSSCDFLPSHILDLLRMSCGQSRPDIHSRQSCGLRHGNPILLHVHRLQDATTPRPPILLNRMGTAPNRK